MPVWRLKGSEVLILGSAASGAPPEAAQGVEASRALDAWLRADGATALGRSQMREVLRALHDDSRDEPRRWRSSLLAALRDGRLWMRLERAPKLGTSVGAVEDHSSAAPPPERVSEVDHWIAIRLEDDGDPPRPVPFARYTIKLPDGELRQGSLDKHGIARLDGIPAGECEVTFPDFDRRAWAPASPRTAPAPRPPPARKRSEVAMAAATSAATGERCVVTGFEVLDEGGARSKRQPGPGGVLQVVPKPTRKRSFEKALPFNLGALASLTDEATELGTSAREAWKVIRSKDRGKALGALRARDEKNRLAGGGSAPSVKVQQKTTFRYDDGGSTTLRARATRSTVCGRAHRATITSAGGAREGFDGAASLTWREGGPTNERARPTTYALSADGCEAAPAALRVEVFPGDEFVCSIALEAKADLSEPLSALIRSLFDTTIELDGAIEGGFEVFTAWQEDDASWQARRVEELRLRLGGTLSGRITVSALGVLFRWPPSLQKYIADIGVFAEGELSRTIEYAHTVSHAPGGRELPSKQHSGTYGGAGKVGLGVYAKVGAQEILGASASGGAESSAEWKGGVEYDGHALAAVGSATWAPLTLKVKVLARALVWRYEDEWDFPVCDERTFSDRTVLFERKD